MAGVHASALPEQVQVGIDGESYTFKASFANDYVTVVGPGGHPDQVERSVLVIQGEDLKTEAQGLALELMASWVLSRPRRQEV